MTPTAPTPFKGYVATITNDQGQSSPCWVCNQSESMTFKDGTTGKAFKVQVGHKRLTGGWSGGGGRYVTLYDREKIWVKASRIS